MDEPRGAKVVELESKILAREVGRLGGFGSSWVAKRLPSVSFEANFELDESSTVVAIAVARLLSEVGRTVPELDFDANAGRLGAIVGSGHLNLNPTIVYIQLQQAGTRTAVFIRAVAKEGLIKQHSARSAVERIKAALELLPGFTRSG